jgi:hypothetical protein
LASRDSITSALLPGIHCAGTCRNGRDSRTMPRMRARALMIRRSEIAMAIVSARSSRRSFSSEGRDEHSGGGNPFVLKMMHSCKKISPATPARSDDRRQQRHAVAPVEIGRTSDAPRAQQPPMTLHNLCSGCADDTILMAALYACIVAAALHMGDNGTDETVLWYEFYSADKPIRSARSDVHSGSRSSIAGRLT